MAPIVFGMISEKTSMSRVRIIEAAVNQLFPSWWNSAPTPAAPTVCATVLSVRIAASGESISSLRLRSRWPLLRPSRESRSMNDQLVESSTASSSEQRNDTPSASSRKKAM